MSDPRADTIRRALGQVVAECRVEADSALAALDSLLSEVADCQKLRDALDAAEWLITCLQNIRLGKVVRGLPEAFAAYDAALAAAGGPEPPAYSGKYPMHEALARRKAERDTAGPEPSQEPTGPRVIFRFKLGAEDWNWPVEGEDSIRAFREVLLRARIGYTAIARGSVPETTKGDTQ